MKKRIIIGIAAGTAVIGGLATLAIKSIRRLHYANKLTDEALDALEEAKDSLHEANEIQNWAGEIAHDGYLMARGEFDLDVDEPDDEELDNIIRIPRGDD